MVGHDDLKSLLMISKVSSNFNSSMSLKFVAVVIKSSSNELSLLPVQFAWSLWTCNSTKLALLHLLLYLTCLPLYFFIQGHFWVPNFLLWQSLKFTLTTTCPFPTSPWSSLFSLVVLFNWSHTVKQVPKWMAVNKKGGKIFIWCYHQREHKNILKGKKLGKSARVTLMLWWALWNYI